MKPPRVTIAEVKRSINWDMKMSLSIRYFGRPLANVVTPYFYNRGWTANQLTKFRMGASLVSTALLAIPVPLLWPIVGVVFYISVVLDCVDGNLARLQGDVTYLGKFLDGLADMISLLTAPFFLGIGCWLYFDQPYFLLLGAVISVFSASNQMVRAKTSFTREWMVRQTGELTGPELEGAAGPRRIQSLAADIMVVGHFVANAALFFPPIGAVVYLFLAVPIQLIPDIIWLASNFTESNALLQRGRTSNHSPKAQDDRSAAE